MKPPQGKWQAWLVDLDGTLYHPRPVQLMMGLELVAFGLKALPIVRSFRRAHESVRVLASQADAAEKRSPYERQLELAAAHLGQEQAEVQRVVEEWMIRRPGRWLSLFRRRKLLRELVLFRQSGGRCALVSDYPAREKLRALGLDDFFEVVVANGESAAIGALKPDPGGYLAAATALNVRPQSCLVVGDRLDADGEAANRAGMKFWHIH
jgi:HAD superfamily hydrolase (TIGR01549 family)